MSQPASLAPGQALPLYGLAPGVECLRTMGAWHRTVVTELGPEHVVATASAEAALEHYRGAERLDVITFAPAGSMTSADLLNREQPGSRRHGRLPRAAGAPVAAPVRVDGVPADFAGYQIPGLAVLLNRQADHAIGVVSRGWPLAEIALVRVTDFSSYEPAKGGDLRIVLGDAQDGSAQDRVVVHRRQPDDYVHADGAVWTWRERWHVAAGARLRMYDLNEPPPKL